MSDVAAWTRFFLGGWGTSFSAYVALQLVALLTLRRAFWVAALVPFAAMVAVAVLTVHAFLQQSNMWPMLMILASPFAAILVAMIGILGLWVQSHPRKRLFTLISLSIVMFVCIFEAHSYVNAA